MSLLYYGVLKEPYSQEILNQINHELDAVLPGNVLDWDRVEATYKGIKSYNIYSEKITPEKSETHPDGVIQYYKEKITTYYTDDPDQKKVSVVTFKIRNPGLVAHGVLNDADSELVLNALNNFSSFHYATTKNPSKKSVIDTLTSMGAITQNIERINTRKLVPKPVIKPTQPIDPNNPNPPEQQEQQYTYEEVIQNEDKQLLKTSSNNNFNLDTKTLLMIAGAGLVGILLIKKL